MQRQTYWKTVWNWGGWTTFKRWSVFFRAKNLKLGELNDQRGHHSMLPSLGKPQLNTGHQELPGGKSSCLIKGVGEEKEEWVLHIRCWQYFPRQSGEGKADNAIWRVFFYQRLSYTPPVCHLLLYRLSTRSSHSGESWQWDWGYLLLKRRWASPPVESQTDPYTEGNCSSQTLFGQPRVNTISW